MSIGYVVMMAALIGAWLAMIAGVIQATRFFRRQGIFQQTMFNPAAGAMAWVRLLKPGGYGEEAEPGRRAAARLIFVAVGLLLIATAIFHLAVAPTLPPQPPPAR